MENRRVILLEKHINHGDQGQVHSWKIHTSELVFNSKGALKKEVQEISLVDEPIYSVISDSPQQTTSI